MTKILHLILFILLLHTLAPRVFAQSVPPAEKRYEAVVSAIKEQKMLSDNGVRRTYQKVELFIQNGDKKGEKIIIENGKIPVINTLEVKKGDKVVVSDTKNISGKEDYFITDYVRRDSIYLLFGIFVLITVLIGGVRGAASLLGMGISFVVIILFVLPQILQGRDPILIAIISSLFIIPVNFYLSHGINKKTNVAVLGTLISLGVTGALANFFVNSTHLSGLSSEEATFLVAARNGALQMKGLLLAGIIIGAVGVLDDITISQSAIVFQLKRTSERLRIWALFSKAMDIGRDHIASMVNTLVLVYTGAALPLLLLFINNPLPFQQIINMEMITEEIVRTLVVSIGLILSVPIVTFLAAVTCNIEIKQSAKELLRSLK